MKYFDSHCHIQFEQYNDDREEVIALMQEKGVGGLVVGTDFESSRTAIKLVQGREHFYAAIGLHPNAVTKEQFEMSAYRELAQDSKVVVRFMRIVYMAPAGRPIS
jgi:TatD DNase family protein